MPGGLSRDVQRGAMLKTKRHQTFIRFSDLAGTIPEVDGRDFMVMLKTKTHQTFIRFSALAGTIPEVDGRDFMVTLMADQAGNDEYGLTTLMVIGLLCH
jgi:hypothetical protein